MTLAGKPQTRASEAELEPILSELERMTEEDAVRYMDETNSAITNK